MIKTHLNEIILQQIRLNEIIIHEIYKMRIHEIR
jgi:hypothetical protein